MRRLHSIWRALGALLLGLVMWSHAQAVEPVAWPASGTIVFDVHYGADGLRLGKTVHEWSHKDSAYTMRSMVQTAGLARLIKDFRLEQRSEGRVGPKGLTPQRFTADQKGKPFQSARFDWKAGRVFIDRGDSKREADIKPGDQDVLSIMHQLPRLPLEAIDRNVTLVNNKAASKSVIEDKGEEMLDLPIGKLRTRHLWVKSLNNEVSLDLWLAIDRHMLPVRVLLTDRKGEILDQQAESITLGDAS